MSATSWRELPAIIPRKVLYLTSITDFPLSAIRSYIRYLLSCFPVLLLVSIIISPSSNVNWWVFPAISLKIKSSSQVQNNQQKRLWMTLWISETFLKLNVHACTPDFFVCKETTSGPFGNWISYQSGNTHQKLLASYSVFHQLSMWRSSKTALRVASFPCISTIRCKKSIWDLIQRWCV